MAQSEPLTFDPALHHRYWTRCLKSLLPTQYTSHDSTRLTLAYFTLAAFDLLNPSVPVPLSPIELARLRLWVLSLQHPAGGFAGSPQHILPPELYLGRSSETPLTPHRADAQIAATFFALLVLALLADPADPASAFHGVRRKRTLRWLRTLQRGDGSFGEVVTDTGVVRGGRDMRYCYLAAGIRWMLRGDVKEGEEAWVEDIDVHGLVQHVRRAQTYDGGIGESSQHEPHAGYAYCAIAALHLLDRPPSETDFSSFSNPGPILLSGVPDVPALIKFLVFRQFAYLEPNDEDDDDEDDVNFLEPPSLAALSLEENKEFVGYNGRCNKVADTCYCWWVGGTLALLSKESLLNAAPSRAFLLAKTQHRIGGFSKHPGGPPDLYHAYLGLAALSILREPGLAPFDPALCVGSGVAGRIALARERTILERVE